MTIIRRSTILGRGFGRRWLGPRWLDDPGAAVVAGASVASEDVLVLAAGGGEQRERDDAGEYESPL